MATPCFGRNFLIIGTTMFVLSSQMMNIMSLNLEGNLSSDLLRSYNKIQRPVGNANDPVKVQIGQKLFQLKQLNMKRNTLELGVWLTMIWKDSRLSWNTTEYGGIAVIHFPYNLPWKPDITLFNSADSHQDKKRDNLITDVQVHNDGLIRWSGPLSVETSCKVDVTLFPFDRQVCSVVYGSWTSANDRVKISVIENDTNTYAESFVNSGDWSIVGIKIAVNDKSYSCCKLPFSQIEFKITLQRKPLFYLAYLIVPSIVITALILLVFRIPPAAGERIGLGITVLLDMSVFLLVISSFLPETSENIPLIGVFFVSLLVEMTLAFACSCITVWLYFNEGPITGILGKIVTLLYKRRKFCRKSKEKEGNGESETATKAEAVGNEGGIKEMREWLTRKIDLVLFYFFAALMFTTAVAIVWIKPEVAL